MYDKYNSARPVTPSSSKLVKHKGILIVPVGSATPFMNAWLLNSSVGATVNAGFTFAAASTLGPQILPIEVYSITSLTGACAYLLG